ncbi:hypothetical protein [Cupriavidus sp.]|uniref:hypothetical protein n=2 Tax=Cupriavidus sp. TaxID=1873897 RepID=UPI0025C01A5A|nr:hypothetical protein [Cupriavidus sp.]
MIFGSRQDFAIEVMMEPDLTPPSAVYGRMRVWCKGVQFGDFSDPRCALYPAYLGFKELLQILPELWLEDLDGLGDLQLADRVDLLLYGARGDQLIDDARTVDECQRDWRIHRRFSFLNNWGEQFDRDTKSFIFCPPSRKVKILVRTSDVEEVISLQTSLLDVTTAIQHFLKWFEDSAALLSEPPHPRSNQS